MNEEEKYKTKIEQVLNDEVSDSKELPLLESQKETLREYYDTLRLGKRTNFSKRLEQEGKKRCRPKARSYKSFYAYILVLSKFAKFIKKPFDEVNEKDIDSYRASLKDRKLSDVTFNYYSLIIKMFFIWFLKCEEIPKMINYDIDKQKLKVLKPEEVLLPSEIKQIIKKCSNSRDKAIVSMLFESACRVGELVNIKLKNIHFDDYGIKINVKGKTGERNIRLIDCVGYVQNWINEHPEKDNLESCLFVSFSENNYGKQLTGRGIQSIVETLGKRAGIKKKLNPHWFRHSGLDWLAQNNFNERDLKIRAGWTMQSKMHLVYLHYGEDEVDRKYCKIKGKEKLSRNKMIEEEQLKPIICPRCNKENNPDSKYCNCGQVLDKKEAIKLEKMNQKADVFVDKLLQTPISEKEDLSKGIMEALFQTMKKNPIMLDEFKKILSESKEVEK